jgi:hypothetical protein
MRDIRSFLTSIGLDSIDLLTIRWDASATRAPRTRHHPVTWITRVRRDGVKKRRRDVWWHRPTRRTHRRGYYPVPLLVIEKVNADRDGTRSDQVREGAT